VGGSVAATCGPGGRTGRRGRRQPLGADAVLLRCGRVDAARRIDWFGDGRVVGALGERW
jgi:hypothetical protein